jgi:arsenate reductase
VVTTEAVQASDVVITMGCGDACPVFPGKRYLDRQLDDPAGRDLPAVRRIRDGIERRVRDLLAQLTPTHHQVDHRRDDHRSHHDDECHRCHGQSRVGE